MVWYSHLFQNFTQLIVIHTVKGFGIVNKAEIDVFLELSCFFYDPEDVGNLISGSSAFSKTSLNIRKFMVHILLKPGLENFEHGLANLKQCKEIGMAGLSHKQSALPFFSVHTGKRIMQVLTRPRGLGPGQNCHVPEACPQHILFPLNGPLLPTPGPLRIPGHPPSLQVFL